MLFAGIALVGCGVMAAGYRKVGRPIPGLLKFVIVLAAIWFVFRSVQLVVYLLR
jgi:hypothetical protein